MNPLLKRLLKMSENHNVPVIIYDSKTDHAGVLMSLDYFENNFGEMPSAPAFQPDFDEEEDFDDSLAPAAEFLQGLDQLENEISEKFDPVEQTNEELALWKAQREEKERREIERTLEEELIENPPADPFEEDFLHTPEWHTSTDIPETPKEPSYHPVLNTGGSLSWSDWGFTTSSFTPIPENNEELPLEESGEDPIFLEEPV